MSPRSRNSSAVAWPMPEAAPVMTTMRGVGHSAQTRTCSSCSATSRQTSSNVEVMTALTIGQLAERSGVATSAIRFYESRGLIASERTTGNQRRYAQSTLRRVAFIRTAQRIGLTLEEIGAGAGHAARPAYADQGRLAPAQPGLAAAARRPDPPDRAAPRPAGRLHRLRLPQPEVLRAHQPRRRPRRPRPRRRPARPRPSALVTSSGSRDALESRAAVPPTALSPRA